MGGLTPTDWAAIGGVYSTILGSVWALGRYLDGRFTKVFEKIEAVKEQVLSKLEYHERHDDKRFSQVRDDIWETRLRVEGKNYIKVNKPKNDQEAA